MRLIYFSLLMVASVIPGSRSASYFDNMSLSLTYLDRFDIENKEEGLKEPSGLTLSYERDALWTVSDDTKKVFKLNLDGKLQKDKSFKRFFRNLL